mgnify:CR=1 FL=1
MKRRFQRRDKSVIFALGPRLFPADFIFSYPGDLKIGLLTEDRVLSNRCLRMELGRIFNCAVLSLFSLLDSLLLLHQTLGFRINDNRELTTRRRMIKMNISRKLGMLVFCGVPAIIGGGIVFAIFDSYIPVLIYEILLYFASGVMISK